MTDRTEKNIEETNDYFNDIKLCENISPLVSSQNKMVAVRLRYTHYYHIIYCKAHFRGSWKSGYAQGSVS